MSGDRTGGRERTGDRMCSRSRRSPARPCGLPLLAIVLAAAPAALVRADVLRLRDGTALAGEVLEENEHIVRFRCEIEGRWTTMTYSRSRVETLEREEGDQSDLGALRAAEPRQAERGGGAAGGGGSAPAPAPSSAAGRLRVVVIPLHGQVGGTVGDRLRGTFDAAILEQCLERAEREDAAAVILDVDSPGGRVDEMERICETIVGWHDRLRIVAFPREAYSAAAIISLTCRELAVRPGGQIGAAVIVTRGPGGLTAVEAKEASPHLARERHYMAAAGRPYAIVKAMTVPETELWWSPDAGFTTSGADGDGDGAAGPAGRTKIDDASTVLTMTADEALRWGVAIASAPSVTALLPEIGLPGDAEVVSLAGDVDRYAAEIDRRFDRLRADIDEYFHALVGMRGEMLAYLTAAKQDDHEAMDRHAAELNRMGTDLTRAGRRIESSDRSILARRVDVPDAMIERIRADRTLARGIPALIRANTSEGYDAAADRFNEMIREWRRMLGM